MGLLLGLLPVQKFLLTHHQYKQFYQGVAKCGHRKFSFSFLIQISEHFHIYSRLHWANHPDLDIITWIHMMPILAIGDDIRSGTKANACHGQMQAAWEPRWKTTTQKGFQMDDGNPPPLLDDTETGWFQTKNILNWEWIRVRWLLCSLWYKHTFSYFMLFTSHHHDITLKFTFSSWCQNSETEGKYKNLHCTLTLISSIKMHSIQLMTWISELLLQ